MLSSRYRLRPESNMYPFICRLSTLRLYKDVTSAHVHSRCNSLFHETNFDLTPTLTLKSDLPSPIKHTGVYGNNQRCQTLKCGLMLPIYGKERSGKHWKCRVYAMKQPLRRGESPDAHSIRGSSIVSHIKPIVYALVKPHQPHHSFTMTVP
jgi:hypothetical protein